MVTLAPPLISESVRRPKFTYADFFCGIGGFHIAASNLGLEVVFACDVDAEARRAYKANFGLTPMGDIVSISPDDGKWLAWKSSEH